MCFKHFYLFAIRLSHGWTRTRTRTRTHNSNSNALRLASDWQLYTMPAHSVKRISFIQYKFKRHPCDSVRISLLAKLLKAFNFLAKHICHQRHEKSIVATIHYNSFKRSIFSTINKCQLPIFVTKNPTSDLE